jgi:branched-chain amino acid transport system substrate-binding protein
LKTTFTLAAFCSVLATALTASFPATAADDVVKIGFITDMSGPYADFDGPGGVEAIRMAIADFGGSVNGKKIELAAVDHQNKADICVKRKLMISSRRTVSYGRTAAWCTTCT